MFKTELHLHSHEASICCDLPTEEIAARYVAAGYRTITVTDHFTPVTSRREGAWSETVSWFLSGYRTYAALLAGRISVLFGFELRFDGYANDYLVYGLGEDFLLARRDLPFLSRREAFQEIHAAGGLIYAAHPFRDKMTIFPPDGLDGIEIFNAHNGHDSRNELAFAFAKRHHLSGIAGSDFHHSYSHPSAGIITKNAITTNEELLAALRAGEYRTFGEIVPRETE